jgi:cell wall-associated NlpC family hydrolase
MTPLFEDLGRCTVLLAAAERWLGTPFHRYASLRGVGVDCVHLVAELYGAAGAIPQPYTLPRYSMDGGHHNESSILLDYVDSTGRFAPIAIDAALPSRGCVGCGETGTQPNLPALMVGDLIGFKIGRVVHHAGIYLGGPEALFVHAVQQYGCVTNTLRDSTWLTRVAAIRRPMA